VVLVAWRRSGKGYMCPILVWGSLVKREAIGDLPWHVMSEHGDPLDSKFQITPYIKFKDPNDV
jgi:hypothetical protein